jgi:hypothetical protein
MSKNLQKKSKHGKLHITKEITYELLLDSAIIILCNKGRRMHSTSSFFKITERTKKKAKFFFPTSREDDFSAHQHVG